MKKFITNDPLQFIKWFPEVSEKLFVHIRGLEITFKCEGDNGKKELFIFKPTENINPLADYRS